MLHQIEPTATAGRLHVDFEVGTLRRVILHRPDLDLRRLTPRNREALLFDDVRGRATRADADTVAIN